jgi:hypothetical protein
VRWWGAIVVSPWRSPLVGLVFCALVGAMLGFAAGLLMAVWPLLRALWHWLTELVTVAVLAGSGTALVSWLGPWWAVAAVSGAAGFVVAVSPLRRRLRAVVWCAIVRHRLRVCFAAFIRARNRLNPGLAPLILMARPTPAGERVWLWLRTGLDAAELESRTAKIAVTCWAADVQVTTSCRFAALVRLDVTRRDPLTMLVASPLPGWCPASPRRRRRRRWTCAPRPWTSTTRSKNFRPWGRAAVTAHRPGPGRLSFPPVPVLSTPPDAKGP